MKIIVGTGQVGLAVLDALLSQNPKEEITLVNRSGKLKRPVPANVQVTAADGTDPHELEFVAREAEVIFSCTDVAYPQWKGFYPAVAEALAYTLGRTHARLVFADNLYSYGNVSGEVMHENLPHKATTKKGRIRADVINRLLRSGDEFTNRVAVVKAADFIGPGIHKGLFGIDFLNRLYRGKPVFLFGQPAVPHTFTYIHDFAAAMVNVANAKDASGQVWHVPNARSISVKAWINLFEKETGRKAAVKVLPKFLVRTAGLFNPLTRELHELAYQFEHPYLVDHAKYAERFNNHATPPSAIVKETVARYRQCTDEQRQ